MPELSGNQTQLWKSDQIKNMKFSALYKLKCDTLCDNDSLQMKNLHAGFPKWQQSEVTTPPIDLKIYRTCLCMYIHGDLPA